MKKKIIFFHLHVFLSFYLQNIATMISFISCSSIINVNIMNYCWFTIYCNFFSFLDKRGLIENPQ